MVGSWGFEGGGGEPDPGPSEGGGPAPLAQHPSAMLTADGGTNPANRPLGGCFRLSTAADRHLL